MILLVVVGSSSSWETRAATESPNPLAVYEEQARSLMERIQGLQGDATNLVEALDSLSRNDVETSREKVDELIEEISALLFLARNSSDMNRAIDQALNWARSNQNRISKDQELDEETKEHLLNEWASEITRLETAKVTVTAAYRGLQEIYGVLSSKRRKISEFLLLHKMDLVLQQMEKFALDLAQLNTDLSHWLSGFGVELERDDSS